MAMPELLIRSGRASFNSTEFVDRTASLGNTGDF
jgi:hypothetical protein